MKRSTWKLGISGLVAVLIVFGAGALAAAPAAPDRGEPAPVPEATGGTASTVAAVGASTCTDGIDASLETAFVGPVDGPLEVGAPCCAPLCDATCGVGEPCLCKRCVVLGCGL